MAGLAQTDVTQVQAAPASLLDSPLAAPLVIDIEARVERAWRQHRHGLDAPADSIVDLARRHVGLHAARQLTPWMTLHSRLPGTRAVALRQTLRDRDLLRVRCMRRTLHLLPPDLAAVAHVATRPQRLAPCELASRRLGLTGTKRARIEAAARGALSDGTLSYVALSDLLAGGVKGDPRRATELARQAIKNLWESGELVLGDASESLHHEQRTFALAADVAPGLLDPPTFEDAVETLLREYLRSYGPVTRRDFSWWSGIALRDARAAWERVGDELVAVRVAGIDDDMLALGVTISELLDGDWQTEAEPRVRALAYEDPSLKGYFATRVRYVTEADRGQLFNTIGEARASVLIDGVAAAVWHWDRARQDATIEYLSVTPHQMRSRVRTAVREAAEFLRSEPRLVG